MFYGPPTSQVVNLKKHTDEWQLRIFLSEQRREFNLNKHLVKMSGSLWEFTPQALYNYLHTHASANKSKQQWLRSCSKVTPLMRFCSVWACWIASADSLTIYFSFWCRSVTSKLIWISATDIQTINISMHIAWRWKNTKIDCPEMNH